jgi:creatinine amidohydrolase
MEHASTGERIPFVIDGLTQAGVWTPRPWSKIHPDTGSGNPAGASAERGREYMQVIAEAISRVIVGLSMAEKGDLPYIANE